VRPASDRDLIPLGPIAWCWSLEKKRRQRRGGGGGEKEQIREMAIRPENVPLPLLLLLQNRGSNSPFFPPAGPCHACMLLSNSQLSEDKTQHYLDSQMLEEMQ